MHIAENIKSIRQVWGLTQPEFGKLVGATAAMIKSYENGNANPKKIVEETLSILTGFSIEELRNKNIGIKSIKPLKRDSDLTNYAPSTKIEMGDRVMILMLKEEVLKIKSKVFGTSLEKVLAEFEENTILRLNEMQKQKQ